MTAPTTPTGPTGPTGPAARTTTTTPTTPSTPAAPGSAAARTELPSVPVAIAELDLEHPDVLRRPGRGGVFTPEGRVLALVRDHGRPLGLATGEPSADGAPGTAAGPYRALVDAVTRDLDPDDRPGPPVRTPADGPPLTVVVCTHDRTDLLPRSLDAVLAGTYRNTEVVVVDNAPSDRATETLCRRRYPDRVRYLYEPVPGLARARNRGLAVARGEICAFADDDLLIDPDWAAALVDGFRTDPRAGCVTGLVLPAELDTRAQLALERYCGYAKGFTTRSWSLLDPSEDPLFPFATGRLGTGANMAFRTDLLRAIGGFDPATSTGTPARGGEDLLAFLQVLIAGHTVVYRPDALVWHPHRRSMEALSTQVFGFGVGFGAYLTAAVRHRPELLAALLARVPCGVRQTLRRGTPADGRRDPLMAHLGRLELLGLLYGPLCYLRSVRRQRRADSAPRP
ncbi:glycosyltransferase [Kitasatospora purpeofusca]|uniref:glycosyltransferase n=1 Tax=Kitasatospora purpeofusca TaxID=67352 RepID=UPI00068D6418|nr:glycosyltransferase [Kitasatospora purpeofusca]